MSDQLSSAARKALRNHLVDSLVPALRREIESIAADVANEDSPGKKDAFLSDLAAQTIIHELAQFLVQGNIAVESWAPLLHPRQLTKKHARAYWGVKKSRKS